MSRRYTLGYLKGRMAFRLTNTSTVPTQLAADIAHALDVALREFVLEVDVPAFRKDSSFSTIAGQADYSLDEDFVRMIEPSMRVEVSPYYPVTAWTEQEGHRYTTPDLTRGRPRKYSVLGRDETDGNFLLRLRPTPDIVYPITFRYYSYPQSLESATDDTELDYRFPSECVEGLLAKALLNFPSYVDRDALALADAQVKRTRVALARTRETVTGIRTQGRNNRMPFESLGTYLPNAIEGIVPYSS